MSLCNNKLYCKHFTDRKKLHCRKKDSTYQLGSKEMAPACQCKYLCVEPPLTKNFCGEKLVSFIDFDTFPIIADIPSHSQSVEIAGMKIYWQK